MKLIQELIHLVLLNITYKYLAILIEANEKYDSIHYIITYF